MCMKRIMVSLTIISSVLCIEAKERFHPGSPLIYKNREARKKSGLDNKTRAILAQFASIVMGFLGILQDPNNTANVTAQVTDMVNNAVNIVTEAVKKGELLLDASEQELQEFVEELTKRLIPIK